MNGFYDFLGKRALFILFAFCVNILVFSFSQQEYDLGTSSMSTPSKPVVKSEVKKLNEQPQDLIKENNNSETNYYKQAIEEYSQSISLAPTDYVPYYNRGLAYFHMKDYKGALKDFFVADKLSGGKDIEVKNNIGVTYARMSKYKDAIKMYDMAIALDPKNYKPYNNKGIVLNILGRPEEALKVLQKAISLNPAESKLYNNKGISLSQLHKYVLAIEEYNKSLKLDPYNHNAYNNRGIALAKMEKFLKSK